MVENGVASEYTFRDATKEEREAVDNYIKTISTPTGVIADLRDTYKTTIAIQCLICGEGVELNWVEQACVDHGRSIHSKVCAKCKAAVMKIRKEMEL